MTVSCGSRGYGYIRVLARARYTPSLHTRVATMAAGWSTEETEALLGIWGAADVQEQMDGIVRNKTIYEKIATALAVLGYERTWQQCKTKVKNLVQRYKKVGLYSYHEPVLQKVTYTMLLGEGW